MDSTFIAEVEEPLMQPFAFVPWAWRDESVLTGGYSRTGDADLGTGRTDSVTPEYRERVGSYYSDSYRNVPPL